MLFGYLAVPQTKRTRGKIRPCATISSVIERSAPTSEQQRNFDLIWSTLRERQNRSSSSWWFFLLFPKGSNGFGPQQLMFTIAARVGDRMQINGMDIKGMALQREAKIAPDAFQAAAVGWYCDGEQTFHDYPETIAEATLSYEQGSIQTFEPESSLSQPGIAFRQSATRPLTMEALIRNEHGESRFEAWGDLHSASTSPSVTIDINTPFGGVHYIGWRRLRFAGDFRLPDGPQQLEGVGFFQRVAMNVPVFPWKWIWAVLPDETVFSAYVPYVGRNLFRKRYEFCRTTRQEQMAASIAQSAVWIAPGNSEPLSFERVDVRPLLHQGPHPKFAITARNRQGDYLQFLADTYGHSRYTIDRPVLGGLLQSHWDYNEYMFRMVDLDGRIGDRAITAGTVGQGYGNLEYAWGLGL